jgi:hypothetical protein
MRIFNDGNVSINNTSNAGFKLDVNGTGRFSGNLTGTTASFTSSSTLLTLTSGAGTKAVFATTRNFGVNRNFQIAVDEFSESAFTITPSTTIGGSTYTTPIFTLAAAGAATFSTSVAASSFTSQGGRGTGFGFRLPDWQIYNTSSGNGFAINNYSNDVLTLASTGAATFSSSVTATQFITGGTPSNTAGFTNSFYAHSNFPSITLSNTSTNTGKFTLGVTEGSFGIWNNTTNSYPFFINSSNNVLIGTTTDNSNKLRVNGTGWFDGNVLMGNSVNRFVGLGTGNSNAHISFTPTNDINFNGQSAALFQFTLNGVQIGRFNNAEVFGQSVRTTAPTGGSAENWKLGNAATGTVNANRLIRVEIAGVGYDLVARQII